MVFYARNSIEIFLFIIYMYINDIDDGISSKISKFADDTKIFNRVSSVEDHDRLQKNIKKLVE